MTGRNTRISKEEFDLLKHLSKKFNTSQVNISRQIAFEIRKGNLFRNKKGGKGD